VLAVDLPGHGERLGERFTLDGAVDAVSDGVDRVGGRALVVGLSLGGYVAIETRARHPERVVGLVAAACSTPPSTRLRGGWLVLARGIERLPDGGAGLNQALVDRAMTAQAAADLAAGGFALDVMSAILREVGSVDPVRALAAADSPVWLVNGPARPAAPRGRVPRRHRGLPRRRRRRLAPAGLSAGHRLRRLPSDGRMTPWR